MLLGHSNLDSTVRYLGVELDDALDVAENTEIQLTTIYLFSNLQRISPHIFKYVNSY